MGAEMEEIESPDSRRADVGPLPDEGGMLRNEPDSSAKRSTPFGRDASQSHPSGKNTKRTVLIVVAVVVIVAIVGAALYGLATHPPFTAVLRDISIVALALVTGVIGVLIAVLIFQLQSLIVLLRDEIKPILESANDTASTVRGTTTFVSDAIVSPLIKVLSFASGVRQTTKALVRRPSRRAK
jgi:hypothetical protein